MRQGQQNRRSRGRGRKQQNPLARNYESNGPDVKIRGTAPHIAEKYASLARDMIASGDMVTAENYLQHAEHYTRIIMAAQQTQSQGQAGNAAQPRDGDNANGASPNGRGDEVEAVGGAAEETSQGGDEAAAGKGQEGAGSRRGRRRANGNGRRGANGDDKKASASEGAEPGEFAGLPPSVTSSKSRPKSASGEDGGEEHHDGADAGSDDTASDSAAYS